MLQKLKKQMLNQEFNFKLLALVTLHSLIFMEEFMTKMPPPHDFHVNWFQLPVFKLNNLIIFLIHMY